MGIRWIYKEKEFLEQDIDNYYGFVYCIKNMITNREYIGKKFFYSMKAKQIKGKRKKYKVFSDWEDYYGSNAELLEDVKKYGKESFHREIIHLCKSKGECGYLEAKEQFTRGVLESDFYYNSWIMVRVRKSHIKNLYERISTATEDSKI